MRIAAKSIRNLLRDVKISDGRSAFELSEDNSLVGLCYDYFFLFLVFLVLAKACTAAFQAFLVNSSTLICKDL